MFGLSVDEVERPAGYLIVGHVSDTSAIIWTRGSPRYAKAVLTVEARDGKGVGREDRSAEVVLEPEHDKIAVVTFEGLAPETEYGVTALFQVAYGLDDRTARERESHASFRTAPNGIGDVPKSFSFLLGSCNLSIVSINNLAARALQIVGVYAARQSLRRPIDEDKPLPRPSEGFLTQLGRWWMQSRFRRWLTDWALKLGVGAVFVGTGGKWPSQPLLRSPFLKLEALFAGQAVHFHRLSTYHRPAPGDAIRGSRSGASGILAFHPRAVEGEVSVATAVDLDAGQEHPKKDAAGEERKVGEWCAASLILVDVQGDFQLGDRLINVSKDGKAGAPPEKETVGYVVRTEKVKSAYTVPAAPSFTIHAGDQIYFDFPDTRRAPEVGRYYEAYREAWFEDHYQRSFLARGAHYMTLDDHEIVDQYSVDRATPEKVPDGYETKDFARTTYEKASMDAYEHYVRRRHGADGNHFTFEHAEACFFLLDTRTERRRRPDTMLKDLDPNTRMIGEEQMAAFRTWLLQDEEKGRNKPRFVVSSVPFIAEVLHEPDDDEEARIDRSDDKWSGAPFRRQREEIIELIAEKGIGNLVFLVGDMHCAYHASMTVGAGHRWERFRVHELAGGPINQLEHGRRRQFANAVRGATRRGEVPYDIRLHQFHSGANAVMHVEVDQTPGRDPSIHWRVIRTMTEFDGGPWFDGDGREPGWVDDTPPISGRFVLSSKDRATDGGAA